MDDGQSLDYAAIFAAVPVPFLILDRDLVVRAANDAYLVAVRRCRESVVGRPFIDALTTPPGASPVAAPFALSRVTGGGLARQLTDSLEGARDSGQPHSVTMQRYDLPSADGDGVEARYWSTTTIPLRDPDGGVSMLLHRAVDITDYVLQAHPTAPGESTLQIEAELVVHGHDLQDANAQLRHDLERDRSTALALQNAVLTPPPVVDGLEIAVRYTPAAEGNLIGGDWYDGFALPDGRTVLTVGDVTGHDIGAAAAMARLRGVIRAIGYDTAASPATVLTRADTANCGLELTVTATCVTMQVGPPDDAGERVAQWSNAGHPVPVLLRADGSAQLLGGPGDLMLGVSPELPRREHSVRLGVGDTVVLYTDGLVERRDRSMRASMTALVKATEALHCVPAATACDALLERLRPSGEDDVALVVVRVTG